MALKSLAILIVTVLAASTAQLLLKLGVEKVGGIHLGNSPFGEILRILSSPILIGGFLVYGISSYLTLIALSNVEVSVFSLFTSLGYVVVLIASFFLFQEPLTMAKMAGSALIIAGIVLITR